MANLSQFYFAWVSSTDIVFDSSAHAREDELIFSFKLVHDEGQFATLDIELLNPRVGLLAANRPLWAWFSWSDGTTIYPLFFGRLVGIPTDLFAEVITISLIAKPSDYIDQRQAIATALGVLPYYDPIFIDPKLQGPPPDPDTVLEAYSALWHVDRISGLVSTSDLIQGDATQVFTADDAFYDSVKIEIGQAPLTEVTMSASVQWHQTGTGNLDLGDHSFKSYTSGLLSDWPKVGANLQGGYTAAVSSLDEIPSAITGTVTIPTVNALYYPPLDLHWSFKNNEKTHQDGNVMSITGEATGVLAGNWSKVTQTATIGDPDTGTAASASIDIQYKGPAPGPPTIPPGVGGGQPPTITYVTSLTLGMLMDQSRMETISFGVTADLQPILTEPDEKSVVEAIALQVSDIVAAGAIDATFGAYFATDRGIQSIEYMVLIARAHLLAKARVVKTSWDCAFPLLVNMSCRLNALLQDKRLPGGSVLGKVTHYEMDGDGDNGEFIGHVSIESAIGYGNPIVPSVGTPDYTDTDYVHTNYQYFNGALRAAGTGDIAFSTPIYPDIGLQNPLTRDQVLVRMEWHDTLIDELIRETIDISNNQITTTFSPPSLDTTLAGGVPPEVLAEAKKQQQQSMAIDQIVHDNQPWLEIELKPLTGIGTSIEYDITLTSLVVPQQLNLSAASTA